MAENSQSSVKFVSHLSTKNDVMKFDDTNNFRMWRCEVMDALTASNLKDSTSRRKIGGDIREGWAKMNRTTCGVIRSFLIQDIKYHMMTETSTRKM